MGSYPNPNLEVTLTLIGSYPNPNDKFSYELERPTTPYSMHLTSRIKR